MKPNKTATFIAYLTAAISAVKDKFGLATSEGRALKLIGHISPDEYSKRSRSRGQRKFRTNRLRISKAVRLKHRKAAR